MAEWFERSFGKDYLTVYKHRDTQGAYEEVRRISGWLQLPEGSRILDLCCGMGRHSLSLSDFGFQVTGVDLSDVLLEVARLQDDRSRVEWVKGDMRHVPLEEPFDAVVNLFTSFGYFADDSENLQVLREIRRLLVPGGRFVIDFLNPVYVERHLVPRSERREGDIAIKETRKIENGFVRKQIVIEEPGSGSREYMEQVKLYDADRLRGLLKQANLTVDRLYGNYDEQPFSPDSSPRMIFVGHKEA